MKRAIAEHRFVAAAERLHELERAAHVRTRPGSLPRLDPVRCAPAPQRPSLPLVRTLAQRLMGGLIATCQRLVNGDGGNGMLSASDFSELSPLGTGPDAVTALNRTLAMQPHNCLAWFQLGMVYLQQDALPEAAAAFERARSSGFDTFELHFYLAEVLAGLDRHEEAVVELYRAMDMQPSSAESAHRLGQSLVELDRVEEAAAAFKIAVSLSPGVVKHHQSLGLTLESLGQRDEAIKCFKAAVNLERRSQ
jgi:tetratricopeptide (TPR) repeat protein